MTCAEPRCRTRLSRYNHGPYCWAHTPDLVQLQREGKHVVVPRLQLGRKGTAA